MPKTPTVWSTAVAKARLSELIDQAIAKGPQTITRNGRPSAVVVSMAEWTRKSRRRGNLAEFLARSPLRDTGITIERSAGKARPLNL